MTVDHPRQPSGVPFAGLDRQHAAIRDDLQRAFDRVLDSSAFILGQEVEAFERAFADYCETEYCVGVASGTAALTIALQAAGIGRGDEVIVPAHTFVATALAVVHAGASLVLCDVDAETGLMDVDAAAAAVTSRTAALLPVHLYGQPVDMTALAAVASRHGLFVLEDAAQAHGAWHDGRRVGSIGNAAAFSFYPSKNLGAIGDAGAICTSNEGVARQARHLRDLGRTPNGRHIAAGGNDRLDGLQAAVLRAKLPHLDRWNAQRRDHAARYREVLSPETRVLEERAPGDCVYHLFPTRFADRATVASALSNGGIEAGIHYPRAVHEHAAINERVRTLGRHPNAERWAREELSLPMFPELSPLEIETVAEALSRAAHHTGERLYT